MKNLLKLIKETKATFKNILTVITDESWKKETQNFEFNRNTQYEGK